MNTLVKQIEKLVFQDPGNRKLALWGAPGELSKVAKSLADGRHIVITTGFYIIKAHAIETDGPPGALLLAHALQQLGKTVTIVTENHAMAIMQAGAATLGYIGSFSYLNPDQKVTYDDLISAETTHMIALERPGQAKDGQCYNQRGISITPYHACLDDVFEEACERGVTTIGIGDGGNEMGMGNLLLKTLRHVDNGAQIVSHTKAQYPLCGGVSNWVGYALVALLSIDAQINLLPEVSIVRDLLQALVDAGAVDGISGTATPTVDGLDQTWELGIVRSLHEIIANHCL